MSVLEELQSCPLLGFDTESRPSFKKGEHYPISLVQIANETDAYLFLLRRTGIPSAMRKLLSDENVIKIGLGLQQEIGELRQKGIKCAGFVDLEKVAAHHKFKQRGIRALSAFFLKIRISKSAQKSNWSREDLTPAQIKYAGTDAWVSLRIYQEMMTQGFLPIKEQTPPSE